MNWMASVARVVVACVVLSASARAAGEVEIEIQILEMDTKLADLLEQRLAAGGEQAEAVHRKLPDLKRGGKIRQSDTIRFTARSGQRGREGAEFRNDDGSATKEGFYAEHDVVLSADGSLAEANFFFERASKDRDGAMVVRQTVTAFTLERGAAEVIERYDHGDRAEVYLATASKKADGAAAEGERTRARASAEIYKMRDSKAAADAVAAGGDAGLAKAKAGGERVCAIAKSVRSGQRVKGHDEIFLPRKRRDPRGVLFEAEVLVGRGKIDVSATVDFAPWEKDEVGGTAEVAGLVKNGGALLKQFAATPYVVAVSVKAEGGLIDSAPAAPLVARKVPAGQDPEALYLTTYPVQPQFLRVLAKKGKAVPPAANGLVQSPSARKLLEANGVEFPEGASVFFNPQTSSLVARQNAAGHAAIVKIVNEIDG